MKKILFLGLLCSFTIGYSQTKPKNKDNTTQTTQVTANKPSEEMIKRELSLADNYYNNDEEPDAKEYAFNTYEKYVNYLNADQLYRLAKFYREKIDNDTEDVKNVIKTENCYKKAADRGSVEALLFLGKCYYFGKKFDSKLGIDEDKIKGEQYFEKIVKLKGVEGMCIIAEEITEDEKVAVKWFERAVAQGSLNAMKGLGSLYSYNNNKEQAMNYYTKAANKGDAEAMEKVGDLYFLEQEQSPDNLKAIEWYEKAAAAGRKAVLIKVANMYYQGKEVPQDYVKARICCEKIEETEDLEDDIYTDAEIMLAEIYSSDTKGVTRDNKKALEYLEKAYHTILFGLDKKRTILISIGAIYAEEKDLVKAESYFNEVFQEDMYQGTVIADILYKKELYTEAKKWYEKTKERLDKENIYDADEERLDAAEIHFSLEGIKRRLSKNRDELFYKAIGYYTMGDYITAVKYYKGAAVFGETEAELKLADMYYEGKGIPQDYMEAFYGYQRAAEKGDRLGMRKVAQMFYEGVGVAENKDKALEWYLKAANKGDAESMRMVGIAYQEGIILTKNIENARYWYEKAAKEGDVIAMVKYGRMLERGIAGKTDKDLAIAYYKKATEAGNTEAMALLGQAYDNRGNITEAKEYYEKALAAGEPLAMRCLGKWYANGYNIEPDKQKAFELYEKAANKQDAEAMLYLAEMYEQGVATSKDNEKAFNWYEKAANKGIPQAMAHVAELYRKGKGVKKNKDKATYWYTAACDYGVSAACKHSPKTKKIFEREAIVSLGFLYAVTNFMKSNDVAAIESLGISAHCNVIGNTRINASYDMGGVELLDEEEIEPKRKIKYNGTSLWVDQIFYLSEKFRLKPGIGFRLAQVSIKNDTEEDVLLANKRTNHFFASAEMHYHYADVMSLYIGYKFGMYEKQGVGQFVVGMTICFPRSTND